MNQLAKAPVSFTAFIRERVGANWVLARRTPRIVARYGEDVVALSQQQYAGLAAEYESLTLRDHNGLGPCVALRDAAADLLVALERLVAERAGPVFQGDPYTESNGMAAARAAIARARGA